MDDTPQAKRLCQLVMAQLPGDLNIRLELFTLAYETKDAKLMDETLEEIRRVESSGPIWNYATALRLVFAYNEKHTLPASQVAGGAATPPSPDKKVPADLQEALDHLAEALRLRPNWSRAMIAGGADLRGIAPGRRGLGQVSRGGPAG